MAATQGQHHIVLSTGSRTDVAAQRLLSELPVICFVEVGDFTGIALRRAAGHGALLTDAATVSLQQDTTTTSGYRWAVGKGPSLRLTSGTLTRAEITTRQQRPLDLVIPLIKHLTGIDG